MPHLARAPGPAAHVRHRPKQILLYQLVERHYPEFAELMALQGSPLPRHVAREFEDYLTQARDSHCSLAVSIFRNRLYNASAHIDFNQ